LHLKLLREGVGLPEDLLVDAFVNALAIGEHGLPGDGSRPSTLNPVRWLLLLSISFSLAVECETFQVMLV